MKNKIVILSLSLMMIFSSLSLYANDYYDQQYFNAIENKNFERVKELLESRKVQLNTLRYSATRGGKSIGKHTTSPLAYALATYAFKISKYLLDKGANTNGDFGTFSALTWAVFKADKNWRYIYLPIIERMLKAGANPNRGGRYKYYPLLYAASHNSMKMVKMLLQYGADKSLKDYRGKTAADYARSSGHVEMANFLNGVSNDDYKNTLFYAAKTGDISKASTILQNAGSNLNSLLRKKEKGSTYTPLHYAARYGQVEIAKLLISYGAPINMKSKGSFTPLHIAAAYRQTKVALLLVQFGADANVVQTSGCASGFTAFYWAVHTSQNDLVKAMWNKGNINANAGGHSVLYLIRSMPTLKILIEYCNIKPSSEYLTYLSKEINGKYRSYYIRYYNYLKEKGYYNDSSFSSSYTRRRLKNPFKDNNRSKKQSFEPEDIRVR